MAKTNYKALIEQLNSIRNEPSDFGNRQGYSRARQFITDSDLSESEKDMVRSTLHEAADTNQGWHYNSNGVHGAIRAITELEAANDASFDPEPPTSLSAQELTEKVSDGRIFGVSFTKRSTGDLRTMSCRLGVKKFLRGGKLSYSPSEKQLLTVFSMRDKGYRCIPLDAIHRVSISGQAFIMETVA